MDNNQNLPEAIRVIRDISQQAAGGARIEKLKVDDGRGVEIEIPVAMVPQPNGAVNAVSLLTSVREALVMATDRRLAVASGPDVREGVARHHTIASFIDHVLRFRGKNTAIWADARKARLQAVFDYHPAGESGTGWQRHRGSADCPTSEAWKAWGAGEALELSQDELAELLDSRDAELTGGELDGKKAPDPAWMLSMLGSLESTAKATAKMERDPNTHQRKITYSRESGFVGTIAPPRAFLIEIPVFEGEPDETLEVRLRADVNTSGEATFRLQIHNAVTVLRESFDDLCARVQAKTDVPLFVGSPEGDQPSPQDDGE